VEAFENDEMAAVQAGTHQGDQVARTSVSEGM